MIKLFSLNQFATQ